MNKHSKRELKKMCIDLYLVRRINLTNVTRLFTIGICIKKYP